MAVCNSSPDCVNPDLSFCVASPYILLCTIYVVNSGDAPIVHC